MQQFLELAIAEAEQGLAEGGIPIGAVLVHRGVVLGRGHNRRVQQGSAVLHGEMDALGASRPAAGVGLSREHHGDDAVALRDVQRRDHALRHPARHRRRESDVLGEEEWLRARGVRVDVAQDERCIRLMTEFIQARPGLWNEDIGV